MDYYYEPALGGPGGPKLGRPPDRAACTCRHCSQEGGDSETTATTTEYGEEGPSTWGLLRRAGPWTTTRILADSCMGRTVAGSRGIKVREPQAEGRVLSSHSRGEWGTPGGSGWREHRPRGWNAGAEGLWTETSHRGELWAQSEGVWTSSSERCYPWTFLGEISHTAHSKESGIFL